MTNLNRPARLNRVVLGLLGLVLLAAGGFAVATHFGRLRVVDPASALVPGTAGPPTWVLYAAAAVAVLLGFLALRWILAQLARRPPTRTWRFDTDPARGRTELAADAAVAPFVAELREYPGVHQARATLTGHRENPALALVVSVDQDGDPVAVRERLAAEGLPRLRQALDLDELPVAIEFRFTTSTAPRIR
ncbi:alkaline shock response membrane anchor protein AmaP [Amycolatopsis sp. NPDC098790]|uniref:alkaline shock response membrane anchor protein AmaP n=1 Tax=Amycolatopsis sp. NPDC098790 TaxID=3363939 RepID=UPI003829FF87